MAAMVVAAAIALVALVLLWRAEQRVRDTGAALKVAEARVAALEGQLNATTKGSHLDPSFNTWAEGDRRLLSDVSGVILKEEREGAVVGFRDTLFASGSERIDSSSLRLLEKLAERIGRIERPLEIRVEGYADSEPVAAGGRWQTNWHLALARAGTVAEVLVTRLRRPDVRVVVASGSDAPNPFAQPTEASSDKNRTVVLCFGHWGDGGADRKGSAQ